MFVAIRDKRERDNSYMYQPLDGSDIRKDESESLVKLTMKIKKLNRLLLFITDSYSENNINNKVYLMYLCTTH